MRMYDLIEKKKNGLELSDSEIEFMVKGYTDETIPDYQMSAMAMAILFRDMTDREIAALTSQMAKSGDMLDLSEFGGLSGDKHSTGGVGDKTSLIVGPIVASCGVKFAKMSGKGLGHTGGTVDKLASICGYKTSLDIDSFLKQTREIGICIIGQSGNMTPADKKLYALRDVTATVDSVPLIVSSIMSKKLAAGAKNIVLDVKAGSGAFMHDVDSAKILAQKMVDIGKKCGRNMAALITNMDVPLGNAVGNSLEVIEAIDVLKNKQKGELREICVELSALIVSLCLDIGENEAKDMVNGALDTGKAFMKFKEWISYQGGNSEWADDTSLFPKAKYVLEVTSDGCGYIEKMDAQKIGLSACVLGAGRTAKTDKIDYSAGIILKKKTGDRVLAGDVIALLYTNNQSKLLMAKKLFGDAVTVSENVPDTKPLILGRIK